MARVGTATALAPSENESELRHRQRGSQQPAEDEELTTEEILVERLDKFLSSVESRLESFEKYFKATETGKLGAKVTTANSATAKRPRTNSFSLGNVEAIYNRMGMIKASVLRTSVNNFEILYYSLEEHYQYFMKADEGDHNAQGSEMTGGAADRRGAHARARARATAAAASTAVSSESIHKGILKAIHYLDDKFNQVDDLILAKTPKPVLEDYKELYFRQFKYYNFNRALTAAKTRYLHYYELPLNWRENRYIINGYRFLMDHTKMLKLIFHFNHNESANIWSHIFGSVMILYFMFHQFPNTELFSKNTVMDNLIIYLFLLAALNCMVLSSIWHTYSCFANYRVRSNFACIDYTGITVLITFSVVAVEYFALHELERIRAVYIGFSVLCGVSGFAFNWSPYFDRPDCKSLRIGFFMGLAFLGICTFFIHILYYGVFKSLRFFTPLVYKSFVWYWIGVVFYGGLIPERWRYDVIINEDVTVKHDRSPVEVLTEGVEHSGLEELQEIKKESANQTKEEVEEGSSGKRFQEIIENHFPRTPTYTSNHRDFLSLWWVDYIFSSHNLWHVCVLLGVVGHYLCVLDMNDQFHSFHA